MLKMNNRVPFRVQALDGEKAVLWIDSQYNDTVEATMPGVIAAEETERSIDMFVHTREYSITLDPLAATQQHAIDALTDYLNVQLGIPATPPITQEG